MRFNAVRVYLFHPRDEICDALNDATLDVEPGLMTITRPRVSGSLKRAVIGAAVLAGILFLLWHLVDWSKASLLSKVFLLAFVCYVGLIATGSALPKERFEATIAARDFRALTAEEQVLKDVERVLRRDAVTKPALPRKRFWPWHNPPEEWSFRCSSSVLQWLDAMPQDKRRSLLARIEEKGAPELERLEQEVKQREPLTEKERRKLERKSGLSEAARALRTLRGPRDSVEFWAVRKMAKGEPIFVELQMSSEENMRQCLDLFQAPPAPSGRLRAD